jgi:hypothetical protein
LLSRNKNIRSVIPQELKIRNKLLLIDVVIWGLRRSGTNPQHRKYSWVAYTKNQVDLQSTWSSCYIYSLVYRLKNN